jgi:hypothetical protein
LAALEQGRITLAKGRILDTETASLSDDHTAQVERQVLARARQQTRGHLRAAARRAVLSNDPRPHRNGAERARRERGVRMRPESDGMATLSAYLPGGSVAYADSEWHQIRALHAPRCPPCARPRH